MTVGVTPSQKTQSFSALTSSKKPVTQNTAFKDLQDNTLSSFLKSSNHARAVANIQSATATNHLSHSANTSTQASKNTTQLMCESRKVRDDELELKAESVRMDVLRDKLASKTCKTQAATIATTISRFDRYGDAMPYAYAASEMNKLGDANDTSTAQYKRAQNCIQLLPVDANKLNTELGLPQGTLTNESLRNDKTGFRAALFKDEATGKLILVGRDTQKNSLVDWQANIYNGMGRDPEQYQAMRDLTTELNDNKIPFDLAGYSKGAGLAQEAGLIAKNAQVKVFNAAGLHEDSLRRTGFGNSFSKLEARTQSFSAEGEFLTFMNNTTDPQQQIENGRFLRNELNGNIFEYDPMKITYSNPAMKALKDKAKWYQKNPDKDFSQNKDAFIKEMDSMLDDYQKKADNGEHFQIFPPVRAGHHETIVNSGKWTPFLDGDGPNLMRMKQHLISNVVDPMEESVKKDRLTLSKFVDYCK